MSESIADWGQAEPVINWSRLGHVYVVCNGKGGVGKTTASAHLGALVASDGPQTLIIDLNGQGNIGQLLGFAYTEHDDNGRNLFSAVTAGAPLKPVTNVRPNLDVVPGGPFVRRINAALAAEMSTQENARRVLLSLADCIQPLAGRYRVIIIDSPPENPLLLQIALCASRFILVPMKTDRMSRTGLRELATEIRGMREHNPYLSLLGVFVFGSSAGSTKLRREHAQEVAQDLGNNDDMMLNSFIRHSEGVASQIVKYGLLAHELEQEIANNPKHWEVRRGTANTANVVSTTSRQVAKDFAGLAKEVFRRSADRRAALIEQGAWP
jgi:cellulose biosynthesis protein BcsQ